MLVSGAPLISVNSPSRLWLVFKEVYWKDLIHAFRDKDVFIYTFVVPALLYPALLVGAAEMSMFKAGMEKEKQIKFAVIKAPGDDGLERIEAILSKSKQFVKVDSPAPLEDLENGKVEAVIERSGTRSAAGKNNNKYVQLKVNRLSNAMSLDAIFNKELDRAYNQEIKQAFADKGLSQANLHGFNIKSNNVSGPALPRKAVRNTKIEFFSAALCLIIFSLLTLGLGAAYPAISVTAEEFERNTIETTCLLPVSRNMVMLGKLFSVSTFALISGLINLASMYSVAYMVLGQTKLMPTFGREQLALNLSSYQACGLLACYAILAITVSAMMIFFTSFCRTVRSAQQWTSIPLVIILLLPTCAIIPTLELNNRSMVVPILNATLMLKAIFIGMPPTYHYAVVLLLTGITAFGALALARLFLFEQVDPGALMARKVDELGNGLKRGEAR